MTIDPHELRNLVHDVNSKCTNLKRAVAVLRGEPTVQELEYLALMAEQSRSLADSIAAYEAKQLAEHRK